MPIKVESQLNQLPLISRPPIQLYGKQLHQNRDVGFFCDEDVSGYQYSRQTMPSSPLAVHPVLRRMLRRVNRVMGMSYNAILVNRYRDGSDYIGAHSDSPIGLDLSHPVASVALGTVRTFRIRRGGKIVLDYPHPPGALLVMDGSFQDEYTHEIPVQRKIKRPRISLTFRRHLSEVSDQ